VRFVVLNGLGQAEAGVTASAEVLAEVLDDVAS
jgi:3-dehydroquinate synthase/shikimate kinase/3-dehydroquinate synthase